MCGGREHRGICVPASQLCFEPKTAGKKFIKYEIRDKKCTVHIASASCQSLSWVLGWTGEKHGQEALTASLRAPRNVG